MGTSDTVTAEVFQLLPMDAVLSAVTGAVRSMFTTTTVSRTGSWLPAASTEKYRIP